MPFRPASPNTGYAHVDELDAKMTATPTFWYAYNLEGMPAGKTKHFFCISVAQNANNAVQFALMRNGSIYSRTKDSGVWSEWRLLAS